MTRTQALQLVGQLMAAYRTVNQIGTDTVDVYVEDLEDLPYQAAAAAVRRLRQTSKFLPAIAEIRAAAAAITSPLPEPDEAWAEVVEQMRAVGWCGIPQWSHPAIAETVRAMGWRELCASDVPGVDRAQFLRMFAARRQRVAERAALSPDVRELVDTVGARVALEGTGRPRELEARP